MLRQQPETLINRNEAEARDLSAEYFADGYPKPEEFLEVLEKTNPEYVETYQAALKIAEVCREEGGRALLVGGSVRDYYFNLVPKDYDIEIYRLERPKIIEIISQFGTVKEVGKAFKVMSLVLPNGASLDVSLPRVDNKTGPGHKGFEVTSDPYMSIKDAAIRRDFTINSLAADPLTGEVYNYYDGLNDIKNRVLRVTDEKKFKEDALRVLRGAQFFARMSLSADDTCRRILTETSHDIGELSKDRFIIEWEKLMIKGFRPSRGLELLKDLGVLKEWHPELDVLSNIPQEQEWHPEGDVWRHTLMSVDAASEHLNDFGLDKEQKLTVMLATLCHDLGKATTTEFNPQKQRLTTHGHGEAGAEPTKRFLTSIGLDQNNIEFNKIIKLVIEHLSPTFLYFRNFESKQKVKVAADGAIRRLAKRIHPATIRELVAVATADHLGRGPFTEENGQTIFNLYEAGQWLIQEAESLGVDKEPPKKILTGRDLVILGFKPGKNIGRIMTLADNLRDSKGLNETDVLGHIIITKPEGVQGSEDEEEIISVLEKLAQE
ncbi:MAG: HD domain-containing protein [Candidatus Buchananbacteria bacterium]|jgi:tRNA nucleotidyltransferase (CCA-adding enzyme)